MYKIQEMKKHYYATGMIRSIVVFFIDMHNSMDMHYTLIYSSLIIKILLFFESNIW